MSSLSLVFWRLGIPLSVALPTLSPGPSARAAIVRASSAVGTYTLRSVDGKRLPMTLMQNKQFKVEIIAGSVTLKANHSYTTEMVSRTTTGGHAESTRDGHHGTYSIDGSTLTIHSTKGDVLTGTISGKTITTLPSKKDPNSNFTFLFSK